MQLDEIKPNLFKIDEKTHLKKTKSEYKLIFPVKDSKGKTNWKNLLIGGRWSNLAVVIIIIFLLAFISWSYDNDVKVYREFYEDVSANVYLICGKPTTNFMGDLPNLSELMGEVDNEYSLSIPSSDNDEIRQ